MTVSHVSNSKQDKEKKWRKDVLRHRRTLSSSSWMPLWRSMKMTSLPREVWVPCRNLTHFVSAVPISKLPISTLMCLVWAPFLPGRRWRWSSPGWMLPSGWVPILVSVLRCLLLLGLLDLVLCDFQLRGWPFHFQDSSKLTSITILRCNHGTHGVLRVWIALPSRVPQQDFNTFGVRAVLTSSSLGTVCSLTRVAP